MTLSAKDTMSEISRDSLTPLSQQNFKHSDLRDEFLAYLIKTVEKEVGAVREVAATKCK